MKWEERRWRWMARVSWRDHSDLWLWYSSIEFGYLAEVRKRFISTGGVTSLSHPSAANLDWGRSLLAGAPSGCERNTWQHSVQAGPWWGTHGHEEDREMSWLDSSMGWWWGLPTSTSHCSSQWPASTQSARSFSVRRSRESSLTRSSVTSTGSAMEVSVNINYLDQSM